MVYKSLRAKLDKSPPQLHGLPIIGSLLTMIVWKKTFLTKIIPKYGDIVIYDIPGMKLCKINDVNLAKKVLFKIYDRPDMLSFIFNSLDIEPWFVNINHNIRRQKFAQSLAFILNKLSLIYRYMYMFL